MSSEEMRTELEVFVNEGLREGWRGWPRHEGRSFRGTERTEGTNRTHGTGRDLGFLDRSYESYRSN
jgi:hypothetical protein